jgi:excisionase family DNA binding protein
MSEETNEKLMSEREAARRLNLSRITLLRQRQKGNLSHFRVGTKILYSAHQLADFLQRCEHNGSDRHDPKPNESEARHER